MLTIRKEQMELLRRYRAGQFVQRLVMHWREKYPVETRDRSEASLRGTMEKAVQSAEQRGISGQADVERFAGFVMEYGLSFGSSPESQWAGPLLERADISGSEKMAAIEEAYLHERRAGNG